MFCTIFGQIVLRLTIVENQEISTEVFQNFHTDRSEDETN